MIRGPIWPKQQIKYPQIFHFSVMQKKEKTYEVIYLTSRDATLALIHSAVILAVSSVNSNNLKVNRKYNVKRILFEIRHLNITIVCLEAEVFITRNLYRSIKQDLTIICDISSRKNCFYWLLVNMWLKNTHNIIDYKLYCTLHFLCYTYLSFNNECLH